MKCKPKSSSTYYRNLRRSVINPDAVQEDIETKNLLLKSDAVTGKNYIVLTHSEYEGAANMLAKWKRQLGYTVEVISQSSWTSSQVTEAIHSRYDAWDIKPDYFVIIGDHSGSYAVPGEYIAGSPYNVTTDLYYACTGGAGDYYPDMAHGRISVTSATQALSVVSKIVSYESTPVNDASFYSNGVNCAEFQDTNDYDGYADRRFCHTSEEIRDYLHDIQGYTVERIYATSNSNITPTNFNNGLYSDGQGIPAELLRSNGFTWDGNSDDINASINNGRFYVFHRDHGNSTRWGTPSYSVSSMSLSNGFKTPVVFSINCSTGNFSYSECIAEKFLRQTSGGAVGVVGAANISYSGLNDAFSIGMIDAIWSNPGLTADFGYGGNPNPPSSSENNVRTMGDVVNLGLTRMMETWSLWTDLNEYQHRLFHWFGDPAMRIWTQNPYDNQISANFPNSIAGDGTSLEITGCNVDDAIATLLYNNELLARVKLSGGSGTLEFDAIGDKKNQPVLTISRENCAPLVQSIIVTAITGAKDLGNTDVFSGNSTMANRRAIPVTFSEDGTIESLSIYHNGGSGGLLMGVYSDASGSPDSRLSITSSATANSSEGWQTVNLSIPVPVATGQTVWLAFVFETNPGIRYTKGTPARAQSSATWSGGIPVTFGTAAMAYYKYSIYCTYSTGGSKAAGDKLLANISNEQENVGDHFFIYPNPTTGKLTVAWDHEYETGLVLTLVNPAGQTIKVLNIEPGQMEVRLDLEGYNAGLYFIMYSKKGEDEVVHRSKVVKSR